MSVIFVGFILMYSEGNQDYGVTGYNESSLQVFNQSIATFEEVTQSTKDDLTELKGNPNLLDILGSIFTAAYGSLLTLMTSFSVFISLITGGLILLPLGPMTAVIIGSSLAALVIIVIMFLLDYLRPGTKV